MTCFDIESARAYIGGRIDAAEFEYVPFPHLIIENFFPAEIYEQVLRLNPFRLAGGEEWISREKAAKAVTSTPFWMRKQLNLPLEENQVSDVEVNEFWRNISVLFHDRDWFFEVLKRKIKEYLFFRYGPLFTDDDFRSFFNIQTFLQRHDAGYFIGPHTDIPTRVATCIFSFAENTGFEEFGTELCAPVDRLVRCSGRTHHSYDGFKVAKLAPYRPNNFLLFLKTPHSFHAVKKMDLELPNSRFGMQIQIYEKDNGIFRDLTAIKSTEHPIIMLKDAVTDAN